MRDASPTRLLLTVAAYWSLVSAAMLVGNIRIPDRAFCIDANAVRHAVLEVGPDPPVREVAISGDIEGRKPLAMRLGHDQRCIPGRDYHAIWECASVSHS